LEGVEHPDTTRDTWVTARRDAEVISHKDLDLGREDEGFRRDIGIKPRVDLNQELWWVLPQHRNACRARLRATILLSTSTKLTTGVSGKVPNFQQE
jgi:hypothetical protein